jgi:bacterioferritin-associated ferredoxin
MYVCICRVVTDREVRHCAEQGVDSLRGLRRELGVASECGKCAQCALQILREVHSGNASGLVTA